MAKTSVARDRKDSEIRRLAASGMSQRNIAAKVGVSRGIVQRVLDSIPARPSAPSGPNVPDDFGDVLADYEALAEAALSHGTLAAHREVHNTAIICHDNGYDVPWHSLPYLMRLSDEINDSDCGSRERLAFRREFSQVCGDRKAWDSDNS